MRIESISKGIVEVYWLGFSESETISEEKYND